jgi:hypothetical protein
MTLLPDIAHMTLWFLPLADSPSAPWQELAREFAEEESRYAAQHGFMRAPDGRWMSTPPQDRR